MFSYSLPLNSPISRDIFDPGYRVVDRVCTSSAHGAGCARVGTLEWSISRRSVSSKIREKSAFLVIPFAEKETYQLVDLSFDAEDRVLRFPLSQSIALELRGVDILMADP